MGPVVAIVSKKVACWTACLGAVWAFAGPARAWEVYRSESGAVLRWELPEVGLVLGAPPEAAGFGMVEARAALDGGVAAWRGLGCGGPRVTVTAGEGALDPADGVNRVVWVAEREAWTARFPSTELARTILIYRVQSGRLVDTDIAVNLAFFDFGAGVGCDAERYDLQGLFAHELGHVFGLDHSAEAVATMAPDVAPGTCEQRTLSEDDRAGYCASYPVAEPMEPGPEAVEPGPEPVEPVESAESGPERVEYTGGDDGCAVGAGDAGPMMAVGVWAALAVLRRCGGRARRRNVR